MRPLRSARRATADDRRMRRLMEDGSEKGFAALVERWREPIQRLCARMVGDWHVGEDLAQDVFTQLYLSRSTFRGESSLSTFVWRIAVNRCRNELRRASRSVVELPGDEAIEEPASVSAAPDMAVVGAERQQIVRDALQRLPEHLRVVVVLRHYEDLKCREVAEVLGIPEGTVKSRMAEALTRLARMLPDPAEPPSRGERQSEGR